MDEYLSEAATLPADRYAGTLVGRVWLPGEQGGPAVVALREWGVYDLTPLVPTMSELCAAADPVALARSDSARRIGELAPILANSRWDRHDPALPWLLAPVDLQAVKAAGVTFARSMLERVVEEQVKGDPRARRCHPRPDRGAGRRGPARGAPGTDAAARLKAHLVAQGAWSQYLEVGIGPDAEIFTKTQPMAAVGHGAEVGIHPISSWNNPEPELVLVVNRQRPDRWRHARQRRQPARRRGPQRPASRQGQGQQRLGEPGAVRAPARCGLRARSACARRISRSPSAARTASALRRPAR